MEHLPGVPIPGVPIPQKSRVSSEGVAAALCGWCFFGILVLPWHPGLGEAWWCCRVCERENVCVQIVMKARAPLHSPPGPATRYIICHWTRWECVTGKTFKSRAGSAVETTTASAGGKKTASFINVFVSTIYIWGISMEKGNRKAPLNIFPDGNNICLDGSPRI